MQPLPTGRRTKVGQDWPDNVYAPGNYTWHVLNRLAQLGKNIHPTMGNVNQWAHNYNQTPEATFESTSRKGDAVIFTSSVAGSSAQYGYMVCMEHVNSDGSSAISEMNISDEYSMNWCVLKKEAGKYFMCLG